MFLAVLFSLCACVCGGAQRPHIVLIVADDLGWNDVGFHGSNQIPTPNLDALAFSGLMLHDYYVTPVCTPSRAALLTGKYPIHTGMQHGVIYGMEPRGLPLSEKLLPQYLRELGYRTHLVGKWHLGHYMKEYLPLSRGFESHLGFWTGRIDMYDHTSMEHGTWGTDFRRGFEVADDLFGEYATDVFTNEAVRLIKEHNKTEPLFLMVAHSAVHSGNPPEPLRGPDSLLEQFEHIKPLQRRKFAVMLSKLDESVGKVMEALQSEGLLEHSVVVFTTDNGGPAAGFNDNAASNYPLRGVKNTLWEGGVRGAGLVWSPWAAPRLAAQRMHIADWLPTLLSAAGGNASDIKNIDGFNLWPALSTNEPSARTSIVHNIDDIYRTAAITDAQWKLVKGSTYDEQWNSWYGPSGRNGSYDLELLYASPVGKIMAKMGLMPTKDKVTALRDSATVKCNETAPIVPCRPAQAPCLFNVRDDPCERVNLADTEPEVLKRLLEELRRVNETALRPNNKPDLPGADPRYWGRVFANFGDYPYKKRNMATGWNDVGFHGSNQIPTPNLDALAFSGLMLHDYYVTPVCTPSRAALLTGKYPIHTGMQHAVIYGMEPRGLPLSEKLLPQYLRELGYRTHLVGKWHLGHYMKEYLPLSRGFESHLGFWTGKIDMYDHTSMEFGTWGTDFRRGFEVADDLFGSYATDVFTHEAVKLIKAHNKSEPLFLMVAHSAVHSGNPPEPLRGPDSLLEQFEHIKPLQRRKFAVMLSKLDKSVGKVMEALQSEGLLEHSVVVFTTDNGGPAAGFNDNAASNYPLRGVKDTLWEGGVRGAGLVWSPWAAPRLAAQRMHIADWLPTLLSAAGGNASAIENIDGFDLWPALLKNEPSARTSIVHNIDDIDVTAAITDGQWKLLVGSMYNGKWNSWYGPSGRNGSYDLGLLYSSTVGKIMAKMGLMPTKDKISQLRDSATVKCNETAPIVPCRPAQAPCLFNVRDDPCERVNLADTEPEILDRLLEELRLVRETALPPNNRDDTPGADPRFWGRLFTNFGDYPHRGR